MGKVRFMMSLPEDTWKWLKTHSPQKSMGEVIDRALREQQVAVRLRDIEKKLDNLMTAINHVS